jgi:hypothetical protein
MNWMTRLRDVEAFLCWPDHLAALGAARPTMPRSAARFLLQMELLATRTDDAARAQVLRRAVLDADVAVASNAAANEGVSILTPQDLDDIAQAVRSQETDAGAVKAFLVSNDRWLAGMRVLHAEAIQPIWKKYENHSIWDTDLGLQGSPAYEDAVRKIRNDALAAEAEELAKRAGLA